MIHPFQSVLCNKDGTLMFTVIKNMIQVFHYDGSNFKLVGQWVDAVDKTPLIKEKVLKEQQRQLAENSAKKLKKNDGLAVEKEPRKEARVPTPGPGAPPVYQYIRNLGLSRDESLLIGCTDSDKAVVIFQIDLSSEENCLQLIKRQPYPKRPNAITTSIDDKDLIVADKFGDVYSMVITDEVATEINEEQEPILGHVSMLTDVAISQDEQGKQCIFTADRDEHIRISHYPQSFIVNKWLFGHKEFVSTLCLPQWHSDWMFSAGGDNFICSWNWHSGKLLSTFSYTELITPYLSSFHLAPERFQNENNNLIEYAAVKIVSFSKLPILAVFFEATKALVLLKVDVNTAELSLLEILDLPYNIVSLASAQDKDELVVSLDNRDSKNESFVVFVNYESGRFVINESKGSKFDELVTTVLNNNSVANVDPDKVYPLYHIASLRKRGEHYC